MFGWHGDLTAGNGRNRRRKQVIYDGFKSAVAAGVPKEKGRASWWRAIRRQRPFVMLRRRLHDCLPPPRRAGKRSSTFSTGEDSASISKLFHPLLQVLVRYNPEGDQALNQRQAERLKRLSDYLHNKGQSNSIFDWLVRGEVQFDQLKPR